MPDTRFDLTSDSVLQGPFFSSDDEWLLSTMLKMFVLDVENQRLKVDHAALCNGNPRPGL